MTVFLIILVCLPLYLTVGTVCARLRIGWWWAEFGRIQGLTEHMTEGELRHFFYDGNSSLYKALREEKGYNPGAIHDRKQVDEQNRTRTLHRRYLVHNMVQTRAAAMMGMWPVFFPVSLAAQVAATGIDKHDPVLTAAKLAEQDKRMAEMQKENERLEKELGIGKDDG